MNVSAESNHAVIAFLAVLLDQPVDWVIENLSEIWRALKDWDPEFKAHCEKQAGRNH